MPTRDAISLGVALFALALLLVLVVAIRASRRATSPAASDGLSYLGLTLDGRAIFAVSGKLVELDSWAFEYFEGRDDNEKARIGRALAVGRKMRFSQYDVLAIMAGKPSEDELVHVLSTWRHGLEQRTRFWTKSEIRDLSEDERRELLGLNTEIAAWYRGFSWYESLNLIRDGYRSLEDFIEPQDGAHMPTDSALVKLALGGMHYEFNPAVRFWWAHVKQHLGIA